MPALASRRTCLLTLGLALLPAVRAQTQAPATAEVLRHHAALVHALYSDTLAGALQLQQSISSFLAAPSEEGLATARKAWLAARDFYGQTEAFRFYGGPIDSAKGPEGQLNAWPLDESYIDGLIAKPAFAITKANLARMNERGGEENIATGWHAIEYLLWGADTSATGPGDRPASDFELPRRRQYLAVVTQLLIDDLSGLVKAWAPGARYRVGFEKAGIEGLRRILVGLGSLSRGELAGERLEVALNTRNQEDEHSCFSDNTHRDAWANQRGIVNVWLGSFKRRDGSEFSGPSPAALLQAVDAPLAERVGAQLAQSLRLAEAIQPPFDQEILKDEGRARIRALIDSLLAQSQLIADAAPRLGVKQLKLVQP